MIFIERKENNPHFNIAAEEFVLKNFNEDVLMLWESNDSVVVGKHQNAFAEINYPYLVEHRIPLIRRISGGGTVFHCKGNINVTVLKQWKEANGYIDFKAFTNPIIEFLKEFGLDAKFEGKNNLTINGLKFSGNSAHIFKNKTLHHGTILFDAELSKIENVINTKSEVYSDRSVRSTVAKVTNLKPFVGDETDYNLFKEKLKIFLFKYYNINNIHQFTKYEKSEILKLVQSRYKSWEWNFAYSPDFELSNEIHHEKSDFFCKIKIKKGLIYDGEIKENGNALLPLINQLKGKKLMQLSIKSALAEIGIDNEKINIILKLLRLSK